MNEPNSVRIDLVSDTATRPSPEMRRVMANAEVGDEQRGEDPSVNALNERVADLLGKEAALFLPSGTMCNQIAIATHCRPGDEIVAAEGSHIIGLEGAGAAVFAGCFVRPIPCKRGIFSANDLIAAVRAPKPKSPRTRLVEIEQTNNAGGGSVWQLETLRSVAEAARDYSLALHMDGARLLNAVVASGVAAHDYAGPIDSVWLDLSKGLGCPVGGVLAGSKAFIQEANVWRHRFGGAMRQAGIIAAAGLYALDHHVERLVEDHENARIFARSIAEVPGIALEHAEIETNIVYFNVEETGLTAGQLAKSLMMQGIRIGVEDTSRMRAVTHLDVDRSGVVEAAEAVARAVAGN